MNRFEKATKAIWFWKLAFWKCLSDAFIAGSMVWVAAIADKDWQSLSPTAKHVIIISTFVAMLKVINAFLDTTMASLRSGQTLEKPINQTLI